MDGVRRSRRNADRAAKARRDLEEDKKQQLREVPDVYDIVSEEEYNNIVADRTRNGQFVVDDSGKGYASGYFDNGEDDFGEYPEEEESDLYRNGELSKKFLKKGEKMVKENKGTVQGRLDRAFFKKGKEFSPAKTDKPSTTKKAAVLDGDDFESFLNFDDEPAPIPKKVSHKRPSSTYIHSSKPKKPEPESEPDYEMELPEMDIDPLPDLDTSGIDEDSIIHSKREEWADTQQRRSLSDEGLTEQPKRYLMKEYEEIPTTNSLNEEDLARLLEETGPSNKEEVMNDDDLMKLIEGETTQKPLFDSHSTENEENLEKLLDLLKDEELEQPINQSNQVPSVRPSRDSSTLVLSKEGVNSIEFFLTDVFEDRTMAPGQVFLFGRIPVDNHTESVCVVLTNVPHHLFFLPALMPSGERYPASEVKQEIFSILGKTVKSPRELAFRIESKKYAFEIANIPTEDTDYIHLVYPGEYPVFPQESGKTFQHVFGRTTSGLETFSLECGVKGTQWLRLSNITVNQGHKSYCQHEFSLASLQGNVTVIADRAPPPLKVLSIQLCSVTRSDSNQCQVNAAAVSLFDNIAVDQATPIQYQKPVHSCSWISPLGNFPLQFKQELMKNRLNPQMVPSEVELLRSLFEFISQADPDVIVGHNITGNDLPVLQSRIMRYKLNWSKLGRLRRSLTLPRLLANDLPYTLFCGRLCVDTYSSAKELIKEEDYSLTYLCQKFTKVHASEFENSQIPLLFSSASRLCGLIKSLLLNVTAVIQLMFSLQIIPLTHQISTISGLWWNRCLRSNRSERVEYYLLHGFHQLGFIVPDKQSKEKIGKRISKYEGGLVLEPKAGLYEDFILVLDFNSLYPSIIQEYNLCYTTVKRDKKAEEVEEKAEGEDGDGDLVIKEDAQFVLPDLPDTVEEQYLAPLPKLIRYLVQKRREVKNVMKNEKDPLKKKQLDIKQLALKILANSMYGCLGFTNSRFCATKIASTVTSTGRFILHDTLQLAEKAGYTVVYGDTDSIMIYTGVKDYQECLKIGESLKREINKKYKYLQIDIDYVFQRMLLLKKKKYAALKVTGFANGTLTTQREVKGIDLVRRDWSLITKVAGNQLLSFLFSEPTRDDFRIKTGDYLMALSKKMKTNQIPLEQFAITKSLTHSLKDYNMKNVSSNPHVVVAQHVKYILFIFISRGYLHDYAGDFIRYVICVSTDVNRPIDSHSLADRAFSIPEIRSSHGVLTPDVEWYLRNQLLPTLSRLVAPLEDIPRSYLCECLGIEYTYASNDSQEDALDYATAFKPRLLRTDYDVLYAHANPIIIHCNACQKDYSFKGLLPNVGSGVGFVCPCGVVYPISFIANTLIAYARQAYSKFYSQGFVCSDGLCGYSSNRLSMADDRCGNLTCQGYMERAFPASQCYLDLCYALATVTGNDEKENAGMKDLIDSLKYYISRLDYTYINMNLFK